MDKTLIQQELLHIKSSAAFKDSPLAVRILEHILTLYMTGAPEEDYKEFSIGQAIYKDPKYDPTTNPKLRQAMGRIRVALHGYYSGEGKTNPIRIAFPQEGYRPTFEMAQKLQQSASEPYVSPQPTAHQPPASPVVVNNNISQVQHPQAAVPPQQPAPPVVIYNNNNISQNVVVEHPSTRAQARIVAEPVKPQSPYYGEWRSFVTCPRCGSHSVEEPMGSKEKALSWIGQVIFPMFGRELAYANCYKCNHCGTMWDYKPL